MERESGEAISLTEEYVTRRASKAGKWKSRKWETLDAAAAEAVEATKAQRHQ
jgi:hypothetical protein